jgi:hypothetical protein
VSLDEKQELDRLRLRVRASRRATSAPMLVFGVATLLFAGYQVAFHFSFVPAPLYWPLCGLLALAVLVVIDVVRRGRTGVGPGRMTYTRAAVVLLVAVVAGNVIWLFPFAQMLLWPTSVLTVLALWQRNNPLARRAGIVAALVIAGWFIRLLVTVDGFQTLVMAAGGVVLTLWGLVERSREKAIA